MQKRKHGVYVRPISTFYTYHDVHVKLTMATNNRLKLDFSLSTQQERKEFLDKYLTSDIFVQRGPTEDELSTMADYLLWGKDNNGKNGKQNGLDLRSKHGTWDSSSIDSLDELMDQPTFNEAALSTLGTTQFRTKKEVFSREEALAQADPLVRESLLSLFTQIDRLDFLTEQYDLDHGKRTKPIRPELLKQFSEEEILNMRETASHWNQYTYLKKRHLLVELRREQYTLRDSFRSQILSQPTEEFHEPDSIDFDVNVDVLPLGLHYGEGVSGVVFRTWRELNPEDISAEDLRLISDLYWKKEQFALSTYSSVQTWIDFRELEHVYQLLNYLCELEGAANTSDIASNLSSLLRTLHFYIDHAELSDIQREILDMKLSKKKNVDIAWDINHKYGKSYTPNYISTIFRQRIIPKINEAARMHKEIIGNIFFPENFKHCTSCGELLLRCPENFTRKSRANDGFSSRCKKCEKRARQGG